MSGLWELAGWRGDRIRSDEIPEEATMVLGEVFERFANDSPVCVMARATLERALAPAAVDALFEQVAERQYTRTLVFSTVVDLMSTVVCRIRPSIHAAYQAKAEAVEAS